MKKVPLYISILIGIVLGVLLGLLAVGLGFGGVVTDWLMPFGTIFINALKLIAVPLIFISLVSGLSNLANVSQLSKMGFKTLGLYIASTVIAVSFGLFLANIIQPGKVFPEEKQQEFREQYSETAQQHRQSADKQKENPPLQFLVDIVPSNLVKAASNNRNMLQVIFFALLFGIALIMVRNKHTELVSSFFKGMNDIILKVIDIIMLYAPFGVLALFAGIIVEVAGADPQETLSLFGALGLYSLTVILGLLVMIFGIYPLFLKLFTGYPYLKFYRGILPAQMLAFSTSSSAATLPVTMEQVEREIGVSKEVSGFVLPIGATVNMDGTSLYQAVAALFIAQVYGLDLGLMQQLTVVLTATLASIGSAAVPSAGIIMLVIVLSSVGIPSEGIALILAIDRPLDMLRTVVNVTGDATISTIVAKSAGKLKTENGND